MDDVESEEDDLVCPFSFKIIDGGITVCCFSYGFDDLMFAMNSRFKVFPIPEIGECIAKCRPNGLLSAVSLNSGEPGSNGRRARFRLSDDRCRFRLRKLCLIFDASAGIVSDGETR